MSGALPSVVVAGAMRCGTTSLHTVLGAHPEVHASRVKEPHHFAWAGAPPRAVGPGDRAFLEQVVVDRDRYRALFDAPAPVRHRVESSAMYLHLDGVADRLTAAVPDVRVVVLLREPARRAYSSWVYQRMRTWEPEPDFTAALAAEEERLAAGWLPIWAYRAGGTYGALLRPWAERLGGRLHVAFLEELHADPARVLGELAAFLGIADDWPAGLPSDNASGLPRRPGLQRLLQLRPPGAGRLLGALPEGLVARVRGLRDGNVVAPPPPDPTVLAALRTGYASDRRDLEELLGRPVPTAWDRT